MKHTTTLIAALSGLVLLSGLPSSALAGPGHDHSKATHKETLEDLLPNLKKPELWIGSTAPELTIAKFVKGDSIDGFESGQVYVVEFWATWCGPCIEAFPHLSELQESYGDDVRFIGVNVWERVKGQERMEFIEEFVAKQGDRMSYTVAVEEGSSMSDNWMKPAGQNGIPAAFIVDGDGKVAWIGHPSQMDKPLKAVVAGEFDSKTAGAEAWKQQVLSTAFQTFAGLLQSGEDIEKARKIGNILVDDHLSDEPRGLNTVAWMLLNSEADGIGMRDYQIALKAAAVACDKTEWKDWGILDTYALAMHKTGDTVSAIKWQEKAIELAKADEEQGGKDAVAELEERLAEYKE
ncbi:MAG: redoxin family protein [Phycisphaerales bacterium]|nr:redoxin family protein [Phycisphaerales bacterium]